MSKETTISMESFGEDGVTIKVDIKGQTDMPFWKHDLKLEAIKELLETIDKKDFYEANKHEEFQKHMEEVQELLNAIWE
ncbi:hypothetical protein ACQCU1_01815 [Sutcliffiella horikoshii]|uniref:hypothetical protein n=1 Tax=Sutcliffiella horikoshii TaxID=79883 RepID=UPI003CF7D2BD